MKKDVLKTIINEYENNIVLQNSKPNKNGKIQKMRIAKKGYKDYKAELDSLLKDWMRNIENELPMIKYDMQIGMPYNLVQNPWMQFYYTDDNSKGRTGHYCGISFDMAREKLGIWIGFGMTGMSEMQIKEKRTQYIKEYEQIMGKKLERGFQYETVYVSAVIISKEINFNEIVSEKVQEDLKYLLKNYIRYVDERQFEHTDINMQDKHQEKMNFAKSKEVMGRNIIYKGFPASGKSTKIRNIYLTEHGKNIEEDRYEILVFHREYTNADFVGMLKPVEKNLKLVYEFEPGPFTRILKKAIENPETNFYLIIEEINRGDAAKIFGDIFQLLDRINKNGRSVFTISNNMISKYVYGEDKKIYIPENLSIIATMNVSDENVTSFDTAFERRWEKEWVLDSKGKYDDMYIKGMKNVTWGLFRKVINDKIISQNSITRNEDKQLGAYFIDEKLVVESYIENDKGREGFLNNIITYLYTNVCKYDKNMIFSDDIKSMQQLFNKFLSDNYLDIFNDEIKTNLKI